MVLSMSVGIAMLIGKITAYWMTGSAAIYSDAAESVLHIVAVGFATFSFWLARRPPNSRYRYGFHRMGYFSAGFEGAAIFLAGASILVAATRSLLAGVVLEELEAGTGIVAGASVGNLLLGLYLVRTGRRHGSLILEANGKHVLTDSWTSFGVVAGLAVVWATGWKPLDPLVAIAVALNILRTGAQLVRQAVRGLLDYADPAIDARLRGELDRICNDLGIRYHNVRFRDLGSRVLIEVHLLFPYSMPLGEAHGLATELERRVAAAPGVRAEAITHLESAEDHARVHPDEVGA
jgi:cation diffusion facilitator family transporter